MSTKRATKRALLTSILAICLCLVMLIGSTFAWFTDTASTGVNRIESGKLDVVLEMQDAEGKWVSAEGETLNFVRKTETGTTVPTADILWEPNCTYELQPVRVRNNGNLALKYKVEITGLEAGTTSETDVNLNDAIEWEFSYNTASELSGEVVELPGEYWLLPSETTGPVLTIKGHMKDTAGNEYQGLTIENVAITVYATQYTYESDSFNNEYDKDATYATPVTTVDDFKAAVEAGENVSMKDNIALDEQIEVKSDITIYGNGNTLSVTDGDNKRVLNLADTSEDVTITLSNVNLAGPTSGAYTRGIAFYGNTGKVRVVMDNCTASANYYAINVAGQNSDIELTIKNSTITGWCAAQTWSAHSKLTFENCTLIGTNDKSYNAEHWNDFATVVVNTDAAESALTFKNCRIEANQTTGNTQYFFSVRINATITCDGCTFVKDGAEIAAADVISNIECWDASYANAVTIR